MRRTRRYQLLYAFAVLVLTALVVASYAWAGLAGFVAAGVVLLIPGRLGATYLRDLFRSRALVDRRRFQEGIEAGNAFLATLQRQPWRRHLVYCHYSIYTWDVEAMARNNIGAARMELGELEQAERDLRHAVQNDPDYAIPYFNLAAIAYARGDAAEGDRLITLAADKGYSGGSLDQLVSRVSAAYARLQATS
jgi:tetratricopeptide (TPR) repeat protein